MPMPNKNVTREQWIVLGLFVLVNQAMGYILGMLTRLEIDGWYAHLEKSSLTPPDWAFAVVWPVLYLLISISGWLIYMNRDKGDSFLAGTFFSFQLLMNWAWTPLFFTLHYLLVSSIWLAGLVAMIAGTMISAWHVNKTASLILTPYFLWVIFALYLNLMIWILN